MREVVVNEKLLRKVIKNKVSGNESVCRDYEFIGIITYSVFCLVMSLFGNIMVVL